MNSNPRTIAGEVVYIPSNQATQTEVEGETNTTKTNDSRHESSLTVKTFASEDKRNSARTIVVDSSEKEKKIESIELGIDVKSEGSEKEGGDHTGIDFEPVQLPKAVKIPLLSGLCLILFLAGLDNTISSTAMPKIGSVFNNLSDVSWIATAYILTFNAFIPLAGRFADIFGRRAVMFIGLTLFLLGSALCGAAQSMKMLIIMRALQGIGGGAVFSCTLIIFADISTLDERAKYQGLVAIIFSIASVLGPLIGGAFVDHVTWRWGFYFNLPIGVLSLILIAFTLKLPGVKGSLSDKLKRVDYLGTALIVGAVVTVLLAVTWGGTKYDWSSATIISLFVVTGILVIMLGVYEAKFAIEPIIPPQLFKIRTALAVYIAAPFFCMSFFSLMYFLPIFWQVAKHSSATISGLRLVPIPVGLVITANLAAILAPKFGRVRELMFLGTALGVISVGLISTFTEDDSIGKEIGYLVIFGFGLGIVWSLGVVAVQSATDVKDLASATALVNFFQMLGGAIGVSISSTVFFNHLGNSLENMFSSPEEIFLAQNSIEYVHSLPHETESQVIHAYVLALQQVWYAQTIMAGISVIAALFIKNSPLRKDETIMAGAI
ncbi:12064_t:CDS:2 [Ambispora gerdemannii]|uniref:MFS-type drug efflux transporter P55 n=1 Tax=Ambispora gerdemannii TaxID=144530 RepID=A0A9N9H353_9GLOM|nr:12064_t:CDS:2 [Ambispora gerdemannii]